MKFCLSTKIVAAAVTTTDDDDDDDDDSRPWIYLNMIN